MQTPVKNLIVGAGISGITLANKIAEELKEPSLIIDRRDTIGGNCFDYYDNNKICIHKYGTHIFHTDSDAVWNYLSKFTQWHLYEHTVKGKVNGMEIPIPFNLNSVHMVFPAETAANLEKKLTERFGNEVKVPILELRKAQDKDLEMLAEYIYENVFLHYTLKQWGMKPEELDPSVTGRVPVYISRDDRYFQNKYQGIPSEGFSAMMKKMLDNPLITLKLNTGFEQIKNDISPDRIFYTGPIDEFFGYKFGELPYRSLYFDFKEYDKEYFQSGAVINYPCSQEYTRIGEYKYFLNDKSPKTVVSYEYPQAFERGKNERYYPIVKDENAALYKRYSIEAEKLKTTYFLGRLGDYKYYDMDKAVERALNLFESIKKKGL